ncbi:MAG: hypothetical protein AVDCRST_MAG83-2429 [uncultured Arthrobacter sp.]|uniref:SO2946-like C-terminal domain-containing protein n=1 Tax=uncultured Arthrobacter sp. TaxID=114050 RepID=A0A6J4IM55_9MICC|nr:hypothetical protein [uncultured Arthrobacter sp.]CAA9256371.1 MAG: hypothetical protein AVDCRST_MAG83-2429 [uncultured Arthrobacter sp.]
MGAVRRLIKALADGGAQIPYILLDRLNTPPDAPLGPGAKIYTFNVDSLTVLEGRTETGGRFRFLRDQLFVGRNNTGATIPAGTLVRITGWDASPGVEALTIAPADNTSESTMPAVGFVVAAVPTGTSGRVWQIGVLTGINTAAFGVGTEVWLGPNGTFTTTKPSTPGHCRQALGTVVVSDAVNGRVHANVEPGYEVVRPGEDFRVSMREFDDFISGNTSTGQLGSLGWSFAGGAATHPAAVAGRPGIVRRDTSATSGTYAYTGLRVSSTAGVIFGTDLFDVTFSVRLTQTDANTQARVGVSADPATNPSASGLYLEKLFADTAWFGVSRNASAETRTTTGVVVAANVWYRVRVRRISGTQVGVTLDNGAEILFTTNLPNVALQPFFSISNNVATLKSMDVDYADIAVIGLAR